MNAETFTTKLKDGEIHFSNFHLYLNTPDLDIDHESKKATIFWNLEPDARERGIKSVMISVTRIQIETNWDVPGDELTSSEKELFIKAGGQEMRNDNIEGTVSIDTIRPVNGKDWTIKEEFYFAKDGAISPESIEVDFEELTIIVS